MARRILLIALALLLVAAAGTFYVLAYTQTGIELAAARLSRLEALGIRVEGVSGRITGPLRITRFELDNERLRVVVEDIVVDLKLRWLALQTIDVDSLTARAATVELKEAPDQPPPAAEPRFLPSFLRIAVRRADIGSVTLTTANGQTFTTETARAGLRLRSDRLWLDDFVLVTPQFSAQGDLALTAGRPMEVEFSGSGTLPAGSGPDLDLAAQASGTFEALKIVADLRAPTTAQVRASFTRPQGQWALAGEVTSAAFSLAPWIEQPPASLADVALEFNARPEAIRVSGRLTVPEFDPQPLELTAAGTYAERTLTIFSADLRQTGGPARLRSEGRIAFVPDAPMALNVAADWTQLRWPLTAAEPLFASASGRLTISGPLPYRFSVSAEVGGTRLPAAQGVVNGSLSREQVIVDSYDITALEGQLAGAGAFAFTDRSWTVQLAATDVNPVALHAEFPGSITADATASGTGTDAEATFSLSVPRLRGTLRGLPLNGRGGVDRDAGGWHVHDAAVALGGARLALSGTIGETVAARWTFAANDLAALLPAAGGRLRFDGSASGPLKAPHVVADIDGSDLEAYGWTVGRVNVDADVDLAGVAQSQLTATARNVRNGNLAAESLEITGSGNAESHSLRLQLGSRTTQGRVTRTEMNATGSYAHAQMQWSGEITSANVGTDGATPVRLTEPAQVVVSRESADVGRLCVLLQESSFCGSGHWQRGGPWQVDAQGEDIPLSLLAQLLPDQPRYLGSMDLQLALAGDPQTPWHGNAAVVLSDGAIVYSLTDDGDSTETVQIGSGRLDVQAGQDVIRATVGLSATAETFIAAGATLQRLPGIGLSGMPLAGRIRARMGDANLLPLLIPEIDQAAGVLTADVLLSGTPVAPELDGRIELARGELDMYRINLALRNIEMGLTLAANRLEFAGSGRAGDGDWTLGGTLAWRNGQPAGRLTLKGENLLVADLPDYRVIASPDLNFLIDGRNLNAAGEVLIPSARIQPTDLSGAVQVSADSRLVDDAPEDDRSSFNVVSEIRITLGDDVQLDTFGLQGRLAGSVGTTMRTGDIPAGRGELSVANGKYEAYGQSLDIVRGRLLFDASPLDDPGLDIQAERNIETIKVGLNVRGTLRDPRFGFYSEPAMSQTQVLSYLLVGKPIDDLQNRDTATMGSARDTLALQGGGILAAQIGRRLGLEEVGVESNGANDAALVLGKFLSPRLFVSYGISLTESINTLKLRYTISDRWVIRTEAGEHQSADVEFTIERP